MKKFLSLVLALVMTMSLVTVSAGAKTFEDDDAIGYTEAVEVVKACKIIDGYPDGSFKPEVKLNRGQAAKIICNLILGPTTASALSADAAPFKDVPADSTFAGYIAYCAKEGIVTGYADGTFKPGATLTGYAFWKMLLGTVGYDANIEGYNSPNWSISVAKRGLSEDVDLASGLKGDFDGQKAVTREEACLYVFNALQAKTASYGSTTTVTIGGTDVVVGASKVQISATETFMSKYFKKLDKDSSATDDAGRPATRWTYDDKEVGTYPKTAKVVFTNDAKAYKLRDAIGKLTSSDPVGFYYSVNNAAGKMDSVAIDRKLSVGQFKTTDSETLSEVLADPVGTYVGNGVSVEVYYNKKNPAQTKIVVVDEFIGKVTAVSKDDEGRLIKIGSGKEFHTEDFAVGDWVLYTVEGGKVANVKAAEKLTGKITKIVSKSDSPAKWTIDGTEYEAHKGYESQLSGKVVGDTVDFYLDSNGYVIKAGLNTASVAAENLVLVTSKTTVGFDSQAKVIYGTGKSDTVTLKNDADTMTVYRYTTDSGKVKTESQADYVSTYYGQNAPSGALGANDTSRYYFTKGATVIKAGNASGAQVITKVNANTTFIVINTADANAAPAVYVGYKNAPQFEGATKVVTYRKGTDAAVAVYVWVADSNTSTTSSSSTYILTKTSDKITEKKDNGDEITYYTVKTMDDTTLKVSVSVANALAAAKSAKQPVVVASKLNSNSDGIITSLTANTKSHTAAVSVGDKVVKVDNGILVTSTSDGDLSFIENVKVYSINKSVDTVTEIGLDGIDESEQAYTGLTYVVNDNGEVTELYLLSASNN